MIECGGNAIAFSHDGSKGALGILNGQVIIFNADTYSILIILKETNHSILVFLNNHLISIDY
jgi:hypothetical protein